MSAKCIRCGKELITQDGTGDICVNCKKINLAVMSLDARLAESSRQCDILRAELNAANATSQGKDDCIAELRAELEAVKQERDSARAQLLEAAETERFLQAELKLKSTPKK